MPQMSPMLWSLLFLTFTLLFLFFNVLNYFNFNPIFKNKTNNSKKEYSIENLNWKW